MRWLVSLKYQLQGVGSVPHTMVAPHFCRNPAASTAGRTPNSSSTGILAGNSDSPTCSRGNLSLSNRSTLTPCRANMVADVLPAGPPPMTTTSHDCSAVVI